MIIKSLLTLLITFVFHEIISYPLYEVHRIIMNDNLSDMEKSSYQFFHKGMILTFDPSLNYSLIPLQIENEIKNGFYTIVEFSEPYEKDIGNGFQVLITHIFNPICFPAVNFILDDRAIKIPTEFLFRKKDVYEFVFLMKENQDKIVFGKDLIDLMNIEFTNNVFVVHNKTFEYTINID